MRKLTEKSTKDAAAVKVLTMITLIYLPATVVSVCHPADLMPKITLTDSQNFFSTEFVSQEQQKNGSMKVVVSSSAWLFAAISIPFTVCTIFVWWAWTRFQATQERRRDGNVGVSTPRRLLAQRLLPRHRNVEGSNKYREAVISV